MKRKGIFLFLSALIFALILSLAACNGGAGGDDFSKTNPEFAEYRKIVTTIAENIFVLPDASGETKIDAPKNAISSDALYAASDDANQAIFGLLETADATGIEDVYSFYRDVFEQTAFLPLICGDVVSGNYGATKFYGVSVYISVYEQYVITESDGTIRRSYVFMPAEYSWTKTDLYIVMEFDYRNDRDFSFNAFQFTDDFESEFYAYGNSESEFFVVQKDAIDGEPASCQGVYYREGTAKRTWDENTVRSCLAEVQTDFEKIDQNAIRSQFDTVDYRITDDEFSLASEKYIEGSTQGEVVSGFTVVDGVVTGYLEGSEGAPTVLTLPANATAVYADLRLPATTTKLIIPANITAVKVEEFRLYEYTHLYDRPEIDEYTERLVECPAEYFSIALEPTRGCLKEIEVAKNSPLFDVKNSCLYAKDGKLIYIPESEKIEALTLNGNELGYAFRNDRYRGLRVPNLKRIDATIGYFEEEDGFMRDIDPISMILSAEYGEERFYRLDSVTVREAGDRYAVCENIKSIGTLEVFGKSEITEQLEIGVSCRIDRVDLKTDFLDVSLLGYGAVDGTRGAVGEIALSETCKRFEGYGEVEHPLRVRLPYSQLRFMLERRYEMFNSNTDYESWDYNKTEHLLDNGQNIIVFEPLSEEQKAVVRDFSGINLRMPDPELSENAEIELYGYVGNGKIIRVPETIEGYPVTFFRYSPNACAKELYLPRTLKRADFDGYGNVPYTLDKIVYDGTAAEFQSINQWQNMYFLLGNGWTKSIVCSDREIGSEPAPTKERFVYTAGDRTLTLYFDWNYVEEDPNQRSDFACLAEFTENGNTESKHNMYGAFFEFGETDFVTEFGETKSFNRYQFSIETDKVEYFGGVLHYITAVRCMYRKETPYETPEEIEFRFVESAPTDKEIEHIFPDEPTYVSIVPTCDAAGYGTFECVCGGQISKRYGEPLGHDYDSDGVCVRCNRHEVFRIRENSDSWEITGLNRRDAKTVVVPSTLRGKPVTSVEIDEYDSAELESIAISSTVKRFLCNAPNLKQVTVAEDNPYFFVYDGVLYGGEILNFLYAPPALEGSVTVCEDKNVVWGLGLGLVSSATFEGCRNLTGVTFGTNISFISQNAFNGCVNLREIRFKGTIAEWNAIQKDNGWDNGTGAYSVVCTDGTILKGSAEI